MLSKEIEPGVFSASCMTKDVTFVEIANTTDKDQLIKKFVPKSLPLKDFEIHGDSSIQNLNEKLVASFTSSNKDTRRIDKL